MAVHVDDLPADVRRKVKAEAGTRTPRRARTSAPSYRTDDPQPVVCVTCGDTFPAYGGRGGWEPHADRTGCTRMEIIL